MYVIIYIYTPSGNQTWIHDKSSIIDVFFPLKPAWLVRACPSSCHVWWHRKDPEGIPMLYGWLMLLNWISNYIISLLSPIKQLLVWYSLMVLIPNNLIVLVKPLCSPFLMLHPSSIYFHSFVGYCNCLVVSTPLINISQLGLFPI